MNHRWITTSLAALVIAGCAAHHPKIKKPKSTVGTVVIPAPEASTNTVPPDPTNPFVGASFYIDPEYVKEVEDAAAAAPDLADKIKKVAAFPTAKWIVMNSFVAKIPKVLAAAEKQSAAEGKPILSAFVVYNLPNRDCAAKASSGELTLENGGPERYKTEFIDKIAAEFAKYPKQRIVVFLEPDSLPNLVTNQTMKTCAVAADVYKTSIAYAVQKLSMPNVSIYMDIGHAGWLGWQGNLQRAAKVYKDVLDLAGGAQKIRGFVTNISNYNTVASQDGKKLGPSNPCPDELTYAKKLDEAFSAVGITGKKMVIDTSRNGRPTRSTWSSWCNVKAAGLGPRPQASPDPILDAYFWVKPPGESDGGSNANSPGFDPSCQSGDSMENAPKAGEWFQSYFIELVRNAEPAL
jgi:cellulose 1,4-beta-cellobiosidase